MDREMHLSGEELLLLLLAIAGACIGGARGVVVTVNPAEVTVARGQAAELPCSVSSNAPTLNNLVVLWIANTERGAGEQVLGFMAGQVVNGSASFAGRADFTSPMPGSAVSVRVERARESDAGAYTCSVNLIADPPGGVGVVTLTVLVPPATPRCIMEGDPTVGTNITLTCSSSEGNPAPSYLWTRLEAARKLPANAALGRKEGTLTLTNVSADSEGVYSCTARNSVGSSNCTITLALRIPPSVNVGLVAGVLVGSLLGVALVLLLLGYAWARRRKATGKEDELPNDIRMDAPPPQYAASGSKTGSTPRPGSGLSSLSSAPGPPYKHPANGAAAHGPTTHRAGGSDRHHHPHHHHPHHLHQPHHAHHQHNASHVAGANGHGRAPAFAVVDAGAPSVVTASLVNPAPGSGRQNAYGQNPQPSRCDEAGVPFEPLANQTSPLSPSNGPTPSPIPMTSPGPMDFGVGVSPVPARAVSPGNLVRMGGVPIMVPAQSRAGSLV
ncbi:immunoglobulin superfamily member 11-like [Petromyzon marinus]|uniref:immunoglobulin superfamily member 11-like n=1 Tax=Petromyzon marinus TaxID=7757 RepID=UPI001402B4FD|nr:immunoglobulin superfamily member 11-like [Petromyzon marinus]